MPKDSLVLVLDDEIESVRPLRHRFPRLGIKAEVINSIPQFVDRFEQIEKDGSAAGISAVVVDLHLSGVDDLSSIGMPEVHTGNGSDAGFKLLEGVIAPRQQSGELKQVPVGIVSAYRPPDGAMERLRGEYKPLANNLFFFSKSEVSDIEDNVFATFVNGRHRLLRAGRTR